MHVAVRFPFAFTMLLGAQAAPSELGTSNTWPMHDDGKQGGMFTQFHNSRSRAQPRHGLERSAPWGTDRDLRWPIAGKGFRYASGNYVFHTGRLVFISKRRNHRQPFDLRYSRDAMPDLSGGASFSHLRASAIRLASQFSGSRKPMNAKSGFAR